jgi:hypothetical protein
VEGNPLPDIGIVTDPLFLDIHDPAVALDAVLGYKDSRYLSQQTMLGQAKVACQDEVAQLD